jgi:hypothetical protein
LETAIFTSPPSEMALGPFRLLPSEMAEIEDALKRELAA